MNPIALAMAGVEMAINLAKSVITALSANAEEEKKHLAELNQRVDVSTRAGVHAETAETKKALENLPPES